MSGQVQEMMNQMEASRTTSVLQASNNLYYWTDYVGGIAGAGIKTLVSPAGVRWRERVDEWSPDMARIILDQRASGVLASSHSRTAQETAVAAIRELDHAKFVSSPIRQVNEINSLLVQDAAYKVSRDWSTWAVRCATLATPSVGRVALMRTNVSQIKRTLDSLSDDLNRPPASLDHSWGRAELEPSERTGRARVLSL